MSKVKNAAKGARAMLTRGDSKNDLAVGHDAGGAEPGVSLFFVEGPVNLFKKKVMPKKFGPEAELDEGADPNKLPVWMPDERVLACTNCNKGLGTFRRKHHCRNCGQIFCDDCTDQAIKIPDIGYSERVRTCMACFRHLLNGGPGGTKVKGAVEVKVNSNAVTGLPERRFPRGAYVEGTKKKKIYIKAVSASDLIIADNNGKADPYVEITVNGDTKRTSVKTKTLEPTWNEIKKWDDIEDPSQVWVKIRVMDQDLIGSNDFMGECKIKADAFEGIELRRTFKLEGVKHGQLTLIMWIVDKNIKELEDAAVDFLLNHESFGQAQPRLEPIMAICQDDWVVARRDDREFPKQYALNMSVVCVCRQSAGHEKNELKLYKVGLLGAEFGGRALPFTDCIVGGVDIVHAHELPEPVYEQVADLFPRE